MSRPPTDPVARFWSHVDKTTTPDGCWTWTGCRRLDGYGAFKWQESTGRAHRAGYEFQVGPIPDGLLVCHHCDNRPCVRGDHLFLGTHKDNIQDAKTKGRMGIATASREAVATLRAEGLLYREIAQRLGISRERVGRLLAKRGPESKTCPVCGTAFQGIALQKYDSRRCGKKAKNRMLTQRRTEQGLRRRRQPAQLPASTEVQG